MLVRVWLVLAAWNAIMIQFLQDERFHVVLRKTPFLTLLV